MQKRWALLAGAMAFTVLIMGCQPRDVDPRFGTVEAGKVGSVLTDFRDVDSPSKDFNFKVDYVEVKDRPGEQLSTCKGGAWSDVRVFDRNNKELVYKSIYDGSRVAILGNAENCQKVGMRVLITSTTDKGKNYGHAVVTKLMLIEQSQLNSEMLSALDHTQASISGIFKNSQTASIIVFKYIRGSAPQEGKYLSFVQPGAETGNTVGSLVSDFTGVDSPSKGIEVTGAREAKTQVGEKLSICKKGQWDDIRINDKYSRKIFQEIYSGQRAAILAYPLNCHTVGMRVRLSSSLEGKDSHYGEAIVTGLYLFDSKDVPEPLLKEVGHDSESIGRFLKQETSASILTFKYIKGSAVQEEQFLNGEIPGVDQVVKPEEGTGGKPSSGSNGGSAAGHSSNGDSTSAPVTGGGGASSVQVITDESGVTHIHINGPVTITVGANGVVTTGGSGGSPSTGNSGNTGSAAGTSEVEIKTFKQAIEETGEDIEVVEYLNRKGLFKSCKNAWSSYRSFRKLDHKLYAGELVASVRKGTLNCYEPSSIIDIEGEIGQPARGQIKIKEIFILRQKDLTDALVEKTGQTRAELAAFLGEADLINVTIFEYIKGSAAGDTTLNQTHLERLVEGEIAFRTGEVLKLCSETQSSVLNLKQEDFDRFSTSSYKKAFVLPKAPCAAIGTYAALELAGQNVLKDQVKVIRVVLKSVSDINETDLEQLGFANQSQLLNSLQEQWNKPISSDEQIALVFVRN